MARKTAGEMKLNGIGNTRGGITLLLSAGCDRHQHRFCRWLPPQSRFQELVLRADRKPGFLTSRQNILGNVGRFGYVRNIVWIGVLGLPVAKFTSGGRQENIRLAY